MPREIPPSVPLDSIFRRRAMERYTYSRTTPTDRPAVRQTHCGEITKWNDGEWRRLVQTPGQMDQYIIVNVEEDQGPIEPGHIKRGETILYGKPEPGGDLTKRFYIPGVKVSHRCDHCGTIVDKDLGECHISYARVGTPALVPMSCPTCESEISVYVIIDVAVRLSEAPASGS